MLPLSSQQRHARSETQNCRDCPDDALGGSCLLCFLRGTGFRTTTSTALSSGCGRLSPACKCDRCKERRLCWCWWGQACVSVDAELLVNATAIWTRDRGATSSGSQWVGVPRETPHVLMRRMTVTAATCSSRSLLLCNIRVRAVEVAQPEQYACARIDCHRRCHPRYHWHVDSYARNNVPHFLATCILYATQ